MICRYFGSTTQGSIEAKLYLVCTNLFTEISTGFGSLKVKENVVLVSYDIIETPPCFQKSILENRKE